MNELPAFLQWGALGLLTLVLTGVGFGMYRLANRFIDVMVAPMLASLAALVKAVGDLSAAMNANNELLRSMGDDVYNGRCRYGAPSGGQYPAVREPRRKLT